MENEGMSRELIEFILSSLVFLGIGIFSAMMFSLNKDKK